MTDIISQLTKGVGSQVLAELAKATGENQETLSKSMGPIFSSVLGSMMGKLGGDNSADLLKQLSGFITNAQGSGDVLADTGKLTGLLKGEGDLGGIAGQFINSFLGDKAQGIIDMISKSYGLKGSSVSSLLNMAIPMVLSWLGGQAKGGALSPEGLLPLLQSQLTSIEKAAPAELAGFLGLGALGSTAAPARVKTVVDEAVKDVSTVASEAKSIANEAIKEVEESVKDATGAGGSFMKLLLIGAVLVLGGFFLWKSCSTKNVEQQVSNAAATATQQAEQVARETATAAQQATQQAEQAAREATAATQQTARDVAATAENAWKHLGEFFDVKLPNGVEVNIPRLGVEKKLLDFIQDSNQAVDKATWFSFDRLVFETNSSILKIDSQEQLDNIAEILKAYPNVKIKVGGYTDNTGAADYNLKLSGERADSVKQELIDAGVDGVRIEAQGYGQEHPIASNDTEEGRTKNRRIDIRVTQK